MKVLRPRYEIRGRHAALIAVVVVLVGWFVGVLLFGARYTDAELQHIQENRLANIQAAQRQRQAIEAIVSEELKYKHAKAIRDCFDSGHSPVYCLNQ